MPRIEAYALIGDLQSAALVSTEGSIDWLCWPRFDSDACFARIIGEEANGFWKLGPPGATCVGRAYKKDTLVLDTDLEAENGARVRITDFLPIRAGDAKLIRRVEGLTGECEVTTELRPRFDYGRITPWIHNLPDGRVRAVAGAHSLVLTAPFHIAHHAGSMTSRFVIRAGESVDLVLNYEASHIYTPEPCDPAVALADTIMFWEEWAARCQYRGPFQSVVRRSLLTIKALTYLPTGGIIAAPTTSLPEAIGGARNWDYRYCWLRDATFSVLTLMEAGYPEEAEAWCDWLLRAVAGSADQIQPIYGIAGEPRLEEQELDWLSGYEGSRPVRVGNGAYRQLQIDVFGAVMDALHQARASGLQLKEAGWGLQKALLAQLEQLWRRPDEGIWEVRGPAQHFVHSKVMAWVAFDRAVKAVEEFGCDGPVERWKGLRAQIHEEVCARGVSRSSGVFTQAYESETVDAACLLLPLVGFVSANDPRMLRTVQAVQDQLTSGGFLKRYDASVARDGVGGGEGVFLACSFWLVENLVLQGRREEARALFQRLIDLRNDVGLLAEEYDVSELRQLGNFPQAFSHFALVDSAFCLETQRSGPRQHP